MALLGHIDHLSRQHIVGWAWNPDVPGVPVSLVISVDGRVIGRCLADRHRLDLVAEGIGDGRHGFEFRPPEYMISRLARSEIAVRREGDSAHLPTSPRMLDPVTVFDADLEGRLAQLIVEVEDDADLDRRLGFLTEQTQRLRQVRADRQRRPASAAFVRPRALVVDTVMPVHRRDAGSNAILSHMRSLQRLGYAVSFAPTDLTGDAAALEADGIACCLHPWYATIEEVLRRNAGAFALVYLHRVDTAGRYSQLVRDTQRGARLVYSIADLHHLRTARQAEIEDRADLAAYAEHLRFLELTAARAADVVITHSTHEATLLRRHVPAEQVHVVPWAVAPRPTAVPFADRRGLAFIGGYGHRPNIDAARFLIEAVMPAVSFEPAIPCLLVGSGMPESLRTLAAARLGVEAIGQVAELACVFDRVRLTVAPLAYGAGVKGKVVDSLAAGVPCVCTPAAAEGLDLPEPLAGLIAETAADLARSITALHEDEALNRACSEAGLAYVTDRLNEKRIDSLIGTATGRPRVVEPVSEKP
ncbi:glycosyltransferase [Methylobacterium sp. WL7]|uniref:glycosyltransferase n=1 Tax=Methylobacterium sp. WL7 TaxID=2603900 RepID=UPI0011CA1992|nr:glycosyltransferase [Methylobacterium sp. WL7]TXN43875.1 glycosyltransferase [Methylobacterium sp. WL7]